MKISEVKIGQMVKRASYEHQGVNRGDIREVMEISEDSVKLKGSKGWHDPDNLDLVSDVIEESTDIISPSLKHIDIIHGLYYHISYNSKPNDWVIMKTESQDDPHRWTGPTINCDRGDLEFEDGSNKSHGAYFGGEETNDWDVVVRYATSNEIGWLDDCITAGELVAKPFCAEEAPNTVEQEIPEFLNKYLQKPKTTMEKYITQLTPDMVGQKIKCRIDGIRITDAKIQLTGDYYICQDVKEANVSLDEDDRMGYKYAWCCNAGSSEDLQHSQVSAIELVPPQFKEGDYVTITGGDTTDMTQHIGKIALLKKQTSSDTFKIDLDKQVFTWKAIKDFTTAPGIVAVDPKKLEAGEIYVYGEDSLIIRAHSSKQLYCDRYMRPYRKSYDNSGGSLSSSSRCRTATDKEKAHLKACIDASKYVDPLKEEELLPVSMDIDPEILAEILTKNFS